MVARSSELDESFRYCRSITRQASSTFYLASRLFPQDVRRDLYALYAFCRVVDDIADAPGLDDSTRAQELDLLGHTLKTERYSEGDKLWPAFFEVVRRHTITKQCFFDLLKGVRRDIAPFKVRNTADLDEYSYLVAGTVGIMCAHVLGKPTAKTLNGAKELGIAMQYTNIMRDVSADASIGRVYLPLELMTKHGLSTEDVLATKKPAALAAVLAELAKIANEKYATAYKAIDFLEPSNRRAVKVACNLYSGILQRIEQKDYKVYNTRIRLSFARKLMVVIITR